MANCNVGSTLPSLTGDMSQPGLDMVGGSTSLGETAATTAITFAGVEASAPTTEEEPGT